MAPAHAILALTFLDPAAGLVAGAIAAPLLVLLYFLKLRRRPIRVSSTLLWEQAVEDLQVNAPFRWLRLSLILLLQLLGLALLAAAFARPALQAADAPPPGRVILLIDRTASMRARDGDAGGRSRFEAAKDRALEIVDRLRLGGDSIGANEAMVIEFAAEPRVVAPYSRDRQLLRDAIRALTPSDQPGDLVAALELCRAFAAPPADEDADPAPASTVMLISDGGADPGLRPPGALGFGIREVRVGPDPAAPRDNLGIVAISARRDEADPSLARVFVRVQNTTTSKVETPITLSLDGAPVRSVLATASPAQATTPPDAAGLSPAGAPVEYAGTFTISAPDGGLLGAAISREDLLAADNAAHLTLDPPGAARVLVVGPGASDEPGVDPDLAEVVRLLAPGTTRVVGLGDYERLAAASPTPPGVDLVVFDRVSPTMLPAIPSISLGAGLPLEGLGLAEAPPGGEPARPTRFVSWRRSHPIMRDVVLDPVVVARPLSLSLPPSESGRLVATPLAWGDGGPLIALLESAGVRRLLVAFDLGASSWALNVSFPVFMANAIDLLSARSLAAAGRAFTTGEPISVRPLPGAERVEVAGPASLGAPVREGEAFVSLGLLPFAGVYSAENVVERDRTLAVNLLSPVESALATSDSLPFDVSLPGSASTGTVGAEPVREVWPWFVLAAAAALTLEWLLYAWQMRA